MEKVLKPVRLDLDPSASDVSKQWKHWKRTFENFLEECSENVPEGGRQPNKLRTLTNYVSHSVFEHIDELDDYDACIAKLESLYCKPPNEIFARHRLAIRCQEPGESIDQFLVALKKLSKDCNYTAVNANVYRDEMVRDSFISGLASSYIRQRLLEHDTLTQEEAYKHAVALESAQKNSNAYNPTPHVAAVHTPSVLGDTDEEENSEYSSKDSDSTVAAATNSNNTKKKCWNCGGPFHNRQSCPAREAECHNCGIIGHFLKVCRKRKNSKKYTAATYKPSLLAIPVSLKNSATSCTINGQVFSVLIDSCSSDSYISGEAAAKLKIPIQPCNQEIDLASTDKTVNITGMCTVDIMLHDNQYSSIQLGVMDKLCSDIILGQDVQSKHDSVVIDYGGRLPALKIGGRRYRSKRKSCENVNNTKAFCNLTAASVPPVKLFENLRQDCRPIAVKSRRYSKADRKFINSEIKQMLKDGVIQESTSPWRAQIVVTKDTKGFHRKRFCVDFSQTVNVYTELDAYPLPRIDDMVNQLAEYSVFSTFDLKSAYHQVEISPEDRIYTAFEANGRLYEFTRIPEGVTNGVPKFQRVVDKVVQDEDLKGTFPYMDNVTVCGINQHDHNENVAKFKEAAEKYNLTLNESKTVSSVPEINILGHRVSHNLIKPDLDRLQALIDLPPPQNPKSLQRTIGLFAYYSKWIYKFSDKIKPLSDCKIFPVEGDALMAFNNLKGELGGVALRNIDEDKPFVVECDASEVAVSATLNQEGRPVAFMSRKLDLHELHYPPVEKEATAIIESVRKWEYLLRSKPFTLVTDQRSVAFMMDNRKRTKIKNNKILNWRLELASLSYTIQYRPGPENVAADTFTRAACAALSNNYSLEDVHAGLCHPGVTRLLHYVRSKNLPFSTDEVRKVCQSCQVCAEIKPQFHKRVGVLVKATQPMERFSIDFKGPLKSLTGNKYILIAVDEFSRFPFAFACPNMEASTVVKCLDSLFSLCGTAGYVHSDRGPSLMSEELRAYLLSRGIASSHSSAYNPRGNGQVERYIQTVWKSVLLSLKTHKLPTSKWELVLPEALHSIRSLINTTTNETPHDRFFKFTRRSVCGTSNPSWLQPGHPVYVRKFVRHSKTDPLVEKVELIHTNPSYAFIKYPDGRESSVSLRDLAPCPADHQPEVINITENDITRTNDEHSGALPDSSVVPSDQPTPVTPGEPTQIDNSETVTPSPIEFRCSSRVSKQPVWMGDYEC